MDCVNKYKSVFRQKMSFEDYPGSADAYCAGSYPALGYIFSIKNIRITGFTIFSYTFMICLVYFRQTDELNPAVLAEDRPRIILMGLKRFLKNKINNILYHIYSWKVTYIAACVCFRSGKTSIQKVVFEKLSPHSTLLMDPTNEIRVKGLPSFSIESLINSLP